MPMSRTPDERLFPAKVMAAFTSLAIMVALFFLTLERGPNDAYTVLVGVVTMGLAIGITVSLVRRRRRRRLGLDDHT